MLVIGMVAGASFLVRVQLGTDPCTYPNQHTPECARYLEHAREVSDAWLAQQRAAAERQHAIDAARQAAAAEAQAKAQLAARREQQQEADRARAAAEAAEAARIAAENAPDNRCKQPDVASSIMDSLNELKPFKRLDIEVVDIEHVTMRKFDPEHAVLLCHMTAVFSNGWRVPGMYETRLNIAGKGIYSWKPDR